MNYFGLDRLYKTHKESLIKIASDVWATGKVLLGPKLEELETNLKELTQRKYAIGIGSATDGIFFLPGKLGAFSDVHTKSDIANLAKSTDGFLTKFKK